MPPAAPAGRSGSSRKTQTPSRTEARGAPSGRPDTTPIATPDVRTSSYATSPSSPSTTPSGRRRSTERSPARTPTPQAPRGTPTASPCRCRRRNSVENPRGRCGKSSSYLTPCSPRLDVCSCARTSRKSAALRGQRPSPAPRPDLPLRHSREGQLHPHPTRQDQLPPRAVEAHRRHLHDRALPLPLEHRPRQTRHLLRHVPPREPGRAPERVAPAAPSRPARPPSPRAPTAEGRSPRKPRRSNASTETRRTCFPTTASTSARRKRKRRSPRIRRELEARHERHRTVARARSRAAPRSPPSAARASPRTRRARGPRATPTPGPRASCRSARPTTTSGAAARTHAGQDELAGLTTALPRRLRPRRLHRLPGGGGAGRHRHRRHRTVERRHRRRVHVLQPVVVPRPVHETRVEPRVRLPQRRRAQARDQATTSAASTGRPPTGPGRRGSRDCPARNPSATRAVHRRRRPAPPRTTSASPPSWRPNSSAPMSQAAPAGRAARRCRGGR